MVGPRRSWDLVRWIVVALAIATACSLLASESAIERERRELREATEGVDALLYRGIKVTARSAGSEGEADPATAELRKLTASLMRRASGGTGATQEATKADYIAAARELHALRGELRHADEDAYPTLLARIYELSGSPPSEAEVFDWYGSTHEHLVLALLWVGASAQVPRSFRVYELSKVQSEGIADPTLRLVAELVRAGTYLGEDWPLLAEEEADAYLRTLADERVAILASSRARGLEKHLPSGSDEEIVAVWHAPGVLLRGLARAEQGDRDGATDDLDAFVRDCERLGVDDEFVWLAGAYVAIERGDDARALAELHKLEHSEILRDDDRARVREAIASLERGDGDGALRTISGRALIARVAAGYVYARVSAIDWRRELADTDSGRRLERLGGQIADETAKIHDALSSEEAEQLRARAGELGQALEKDLERRGHGWAQEAKGKARAKLEKVR